MISARLAIRCRAFAALPAGIAGLFWTQNPAILCAGIMGGVAA